MANLTGTGAPTKTTVGAIGDIYTDSVSGKEYVCTGKVNFDANNEGPGYYEYEWKVKTSGGGENGSGSGGFSGSWNDLTDKPFYDTRNQTELYKGSFVTNGNPDGLGAAHEIDPVALMPNKKYKVVADGIEYVLEPCIIMVSMNSSEAMPFASYMLGNGQRMLDMYKQVMSGYFENAYLEGYNDSNCPFVVSGINEADSEPFSGINFIDETEPTEHTVEIYLIEGDFKPLDSKYLPEHLQFGETETSEVVLEETVLGEFMELASDSYLLYKNCPKTVTPMIADQKYHVIFSGVECECKVYKPSDDETALLFGNNEHASNGLSVEEEYNNSECPFFGVYSIENNEIMIMSNYDATGSTLFIHHVTTDVKKVDEKFIPDTIARSSDIPTDNHINELINNALGVIENGTY